MRKLIRITDQLEATSKGLLEKRKTAVLEELAKGRNGITDATSAPRSPSRDVLGVLCECSYANPSYLV